MQVIYDYDVNGYSVQVLDNDGYVQDSHHATNNPLDSMGPVLPPSKAVPIIRLRQWAIESALDFMETYGVNGDPVRDTSIRGGKE